MVKPILATVEERKTYAEVFAKLEKYADERIGLAEKEFGVGKVTPENLSATYKQRLIDEATPYFKSRVDTDKNGKITPEEVAKGPLSASQKATANASIEAGKDSPTDLAAAYAETNIPKRQMVVDKAAEFAGKGGKISRAELVEALFSMWHRDGVDLNQVAGFQTMPKPNEKALSAEELGVTKEVLGKLESYVNERMSLAEQTFGEGNVTPDNLKETFEARIDAKMGHIDRDKDGKVTDKEVLFNKTLSASEKATLLQQMKDSETPDSLSADAVKQFQLEGRDEIVDKAAELDHDKDGKVSRAELVEALANLRNSGADLNEKAGFHSMPPPPTPDVKAEQPDQPEAAKGGSGRE